MNHQEIQQKYANHYIFNSRNKGSNKYLVGNVLVVALFINDEKSKFLQGWEEYVEKNIHKALRSLYKGARREYVNLNFQLATDSVTLPYACTRHNGSDWRKDALKPYGYTDTNQLREYYKKTYSVDEVAMLFVFHRDFTAFAGAASFANINRDEYAVIASSDKKGTIIHELLHLFGAVDLYLPQITETAAERYLPDSIMNGGNTIDSLSKYLVGWTNYISDNAVLFLEATKDITEDYYKKALNKRWEDHPDNL